MIRNEENPGHSHLLIIGNGFDLQCGLQTRYADFFNERYGLVKLEDPRLILDFYNKAQVPEIPKTEIHLEVKDEDVDKIVRVVLVKSF